MQSEDQSFAAVVVSFYTGPILKACLKALINAPMCAQIILVNNGNPVPVCEALEAMALNEPKLILLQGQGNSGFGRGCNLGTTKANAPLLVFVNPDCVINPEALPAFASVLAQGDNILVGGLLRNEDGTEQRGSRRGPLTLWSALVSFLGLGKAGEAAGIWRDFNRTAEPLPDAACEMPVISGGLMAIRARAFAGIGGFDPAFFLHVEDIDLCRRFAEAEGKVMFVPAATALHIGGTSGVSSWRVERAKIDSFGRYFWKNAKTLQSFVALIIVMPFLALALVFRWALKR